MLRGVITASDSVPVALSSSELQLPTTLGRFRLDREIGKGSTGTVYRSVSLETGATVAVKLLHDPQASQVASFKAETRRVADMMHANLLVPHELVSVGDRWFFSMDLVDGGDLVAYVRAAVSNEGRLARLRASFSQLVGAVAALHHAGLVHLDLKPANVLVDANGRVFVLDFGLARALDEAAKTSGASGTPGYWAPEQALGRGKLPASDCYAIGVMLHEALTGQLPDDLRVSLARAPHWLAETIAGLLQHAPEQRPSIQDLVEVFTNSETARLPQPRGLAFVGRVRELASLHGHLSAARESGARLVTVRGPSGIGKSALVTQFLREMRKALPNAFTLTGRCYERETVPYKGVDIAVDGLASIIEGLSAEHREALLSPGTELAAEVFPRLRSALGERLPALGDPFALRTRALHAVRMLVEGLTLLGTVVLWIDDTQWADRDTASVFVELLRGFSSNGLLVLWTCRTETGAFFDEWQKREFQFPAYSIDLGGLEDEEALAVARGVLQAEQGRAPAVARAAGGNPFLLEQIAFHAGVSASGGDLLTLLVHERLRNVSEPARRMATMAALAGRPIPQAVLFRAMPQVAPAEAARALLELRRQALIHAHGMRLEDQVETWHDQIAQVMLQNLAPAEAKLAHMALAEALEAGGGAPAELAHHYAAAGQASRALGHYRAAADEARGALAFGRAAQYYAAAAATPGLIQAERGALEAATAEALFNAGRCAEAAARFAAALRIDVHDDPELIALRASEAWLLSGHLEEGMAMLAPVLAARKAPMRRGLRAMWAIVRQLVWLMASGESMLERPRRPVPASSQAVLAFEADVSWSAAKGLIYVSPVEGTDFLLRSLGAAIRAQDRGRIARALGFLGAGMFMQLRPLERKGERYLRLAGAIADELDDPYLHAMREIWRGFSEVYPGRWSAMLEHSQRGLQILEQRCFGVAWESVVAQGVCAWAHQFLGDLRQSAAFASDGLSVALRRGDLFAEVMFSHYLAYSELGAGNLEQVRRRIADIEHRWQPGRYTAQHFYSSYLLAMADLCAGHPGSAADKLVAFRPEFLRAGGARAPMSRIDFALLEARVCLSLPTHEAKRRGFRTGEAIARELQRERRADGVGHAAFIRAGLATRRRQAEQARRHWQDAVSAYGASGMQLHAACASWRLAELDADRHAQELACGRIVSLGVVEPLAWLSAFMPSGCPHGVASSAA